MAGSSCRPMTMMNLSRCLINKIFLAVELMALVAVLVGGLLVYGLEKILRGF